MLFTFSLFFLGSLKTSRLKYVILDWTWRDQKLRRMIDIPEVCSMIIKLFHKKNSLHGKEISLGKTYMSQTVAAKNEQTIDYFSSADFLSVK